MLKKNYKVTILDKLLYDKKIFKNNFKKNKNLKFILGDVCDLNVQINSIKDIDAVVFLAEIVGDPACNARPEDALKTNYLSLSSMATLCSLLSISKFIYTSSCSVYGINKNNDLLHESSSLNPISHYARIKIMSEKALLSNKTDTFQPTILRLGTVFGPSLRNRFDLVVNTLAKNAFFNKKITVNGGNQWRPNIHVEDVANGIIAAINAPLSKVGSKIFNLSNEKLNYKIIEIAKFAKEAFPSAKLEVKRSNTDPRNYRVSSKKFTTATKFKAKNNIRNTYNEFKKIFLNRKIKNPNNKIFSNIESLS
jgi:nucleoside-diphosphate-sugar epimerase